MLRRVNLLLLIKYQINYAVKMKSNSQVTLSINIMPLLRGFKCQYIVAKTSVQSLFVDACGTKEILILSFFGLCKTAKNL